MFHVTTPLKRFENVHAFFEGRSLDDLARDLGRARAAHERRPDDQRAYVRFLEASLAFEKARARGEVSDLSARNARLQRSLALAKSELMRKCDQVEKFGDALRASRTRRRAVAPVGADLFEREAG